MDRQNSCPFNPSTFLMANRPPNARRPRNNLPICVTPRPMFSILISRHCYELSADKLCTGPTPILVDSHSLIMNQVPGHESISTAGESISSVDESIFTAGETILSKANQFSGKGFGQRINASTKQFQRLQSCTSECLVCMPSAPTDILRCTM